MARDFAKQFYKSKQWQKCRASYILKRQGIDGGMCETCHQEPGKIVHHKIWLSPENINDPNVSLNHENLKYECQTCHNKEGCQKEENGRYYFGEDGQIYPVPPLKIFSKFRNGDRERR